MTPRIFRTAVPNLSASEITNIKKTKTIFSNTSKNTSEYSVTRGADNSNASSCKTLFRTNGHRALLDITKGKYYYSNSNCTNTIRTDTSMNKNGELFMTPFTSTSASATTGTNCLHRLYDINYNKPININALRNFKFPLSNFKLTDKAPPVITLVGANPLYIEWTTPAASYADPGATAYDEYDGEIPSSNIVVNSSAVNMSALGSYPVTYNVSDSSGHAAQVTRTVIVRDTTAPAITLVGQNTLYIEWTSGATYSDAGATASDNKDGIITPNIIVNSNVNLAALGTYTVTYNVSDSSGNRATQVTRTVVVRDTIAPVITLVGANTLFVEWIKNNPPPYVDAGATALDNYDGDITSKITSNASSVVQTGTIGTYTVTYNVSDSSGNAATQVTRTVVVHDTTVPVITLNGSTTVYVQQNATYTELGATAFDNYDGTIPPNNIAINSSAVNTAVLGTYTVTYNVSDSSGNAATQVTRTVIVR